MSLEADNQTLANKLLTIAVLYQTDDDSLEGGVVNFDDWQTVFHGEAVLTVIWHLVQMERMNSGSTMAKHII